ncbi:MAG: hypothetical protein IJ242_16260 [Clostridia bacterium]|nr:hypothetical protein [Clostridia bacterium]
MTTLYLFSTINTVETNGKWSYGMGKLLKKLMCYADFNTLSAYQKKKLLLSATGGSYEIRGRAGKYTACNKDTGKPELYIYVEEKQSG